MRKFGLLLPATALVVLAAACGGGSSSNKTPAATARSGGTAAAGATSAPTAPAAATTGASGGDGSTAELKTILKKFVDASFRGTYTISGGTDAESMSDGKLVMYKDGTARIRFDISGTQNGQHVSLTLIDNDGKTVLCLNDAGDLGALLGVVDGKGVCFNSDPKDTSSNPAASLTQSLTDLESGDVTLVSKSTRKIVGRGATCFVTKSASSDGTEEECFSSDGVVLFSSTGGGSTIEATEIGGSVADSDFDPPYEVRDLPTTSGPLEGGQ
jgi:hypothetical protein